MNYDSARAFRVKIEYESLYIVDEPDLSLFHIFEKTGIQFFSGVLPEWKTAREFLSKGSIVFSFFEMYHFMNYNVFKTGKRFFRKLKVQPDFSA